MPTGLGESGMDASTIMRIAVRRSFPVSQRYVRPTPEAVNGSLFGVAWNGSERRTYNRTNESTTPYNPIETLTAMRVSTVRAEGRRD